jgi:hypothetical protein
VARATFSEATLMSLHDRFGTSDFLSKYFSSEAGLPDFFGAEYQNGGNLPNGHTIYQMVISYIKWA